MLVFCFPSCVFGVWFHLQQNEAHLILRKESSNRQDSNPHPKPLLEYSIILGKHSCLEDHFFLCFVYFGILICCLPDCLGLALPYLTAPTTVPPSLLSPKPDRSQSKIDLHFFWIAPILVSALGSYILTITQHFWTCQRDISCMIFALGEVNDNFIDNIC